MGSIERGSATYNQQTLGGGGSLRSEREKQLLSITGDGHEQRVDALRVEVLRQLSLDGGGGVAHSNKLRPPRSLWTWPAPLVGVGFYGSGRSRRTGSEARNSTRKHRAATIVKSSKSMP